MHPAFHKLRVGLQTGLKGAVGDKADIRQEQLPVLQLVSAAAWPYHKGLFVRHFWFSHVRWPISTSLRNRQNSTMTRPRSSTCPPMSSTLSYRQVRFHAVLVNINRRCPGPLQRRRTGDLGRYPALCRHAAPRVSRRSSNLEIPHIKQYGRCKQCWQVRKVAPRLSRLCIPLDVFERRTCSKTLDCRDWRQRVFPQVYQRAQS